MDPELVEKFVVLYLKSQNLKYKVKDRIYTITLDKTHEHWFGTKELVCTFDQAHTRRTKKITLLGPASAIVQTMLARYADKIVFTSLKLPKSKHLLLEVNERIVELQKKGAKYMISELDGVAHFALLEMTINTAHEKTTKLLPLFSFAGQVLIAHEIEKTDLEYTPLEISYKKPLQEIMAHLPTLLNDTLNQFEIKHENDMKELMRILTEHSENQYCEIQKKEDEILQKIDELKDKSLTVASFDTRHEIDLKIKELRKKHAALLEKNQVVRNQIKVDFDKEIAALQKRELSVTTRLAVFAKIITPYFEIKWSDNETHYYLPLLQTFLRK